MRPYHFWLLKAYIGSKLFLIKYTEHYTIVLGTLLSSYYFFEVIIQCQGTVMPEGEKILGGPVVRSGDNLPSPGWNRVY